MAAIINKHQDMRSALADTVDYINTMPDIIEAEAKARAEADAQLQNSIDDERAARIEGDENAKLALDAEVSARTQDVAYLKSEDSATNARIDKEIADRVSADSTIDEAYKAADATETDARIAADSALSARVDDIDTTLKGVATKTELADKAAEITTAYQAADQNIIDQNAEAIQAEQEARSKADSALGERIEQEVDNRIVAINDTSSELTTAYKSADDMLRTELMDAVNGKLDADAINVIRPLTTDTTPTVADAYNVAIGNNATATGDNSVSICGNSKSSGANAIAFGVRSTATGDYNIAVGSDATAYSGYAFGYKATSKHQNSVALGTNANTTEANQVVFGATTNPMKLSNVRDGEADTDAVNVKQMKDAIAAAPSGTTVNNIAPLVVDTAPVVNSYNDVAIGFGASTETTSEGNNSVAIGLNTVAQPGAVSIGMISKALGLNSVAIGVSSLTSNYNAIAIGNDATATNGIAIGQGSSCSKVTSVALGSGATSTGDKEVSVGNGFTNRRITNIDSPKNPTDAVNLQTLNDRVSSTLAAYLATLPDIEHGYSDAYSLAGEESATFDVVFSSTKTEAPQVLVSVMGNGVDTVIAVVQSTTTTGATVRITNTGSSPYSNITVDWLALSAR